MIDYDITFHRGETLKLRRQACFSTLYSLKGSLQYRTKGSEKLLITKDYKRIDRDTVSHITYYPKVSGSLSNRYVRKYLNYLYYHRGWGSYILKKSTIRNILEDGITVDATGYGEQMLGALHAIRYIEEKPDIVRSFNILTSPRFKCNPDIAFMFSHYLSFGAGEVGISTVGYLGHVMLCTSTIGVHSVVKYATQFPYPPVSKVKYNDILDPRVLHKYLGEITPGTTLFKSLTILEVNDVIPDKSLGVFINSIQKGVDNYNENKK